jgi:hypothetical protein
LQTPPPAGSAVRFQIIPEPGVEVSAFGYMIGADNYLVPPLVPSTITCEASHGTALDHSPNPGETEEFTFYNPTDNQYNYFLGVAAYKDNALSGAFTIKVDITEPPPRHCEESLPGSSYPIWPSNVHLVSYTTDDGAGTQTGTASGDLSDGACTNLDFAADSAVACFPATQFDKFKGNHVYHALDEPMPPNSIITITATPSDGVDVNLYGLQVGETDYPVPPYVPSGVCEASYPAGQAANAGIAESIQFYNPSDSNSYNIFFAVAGAAKEGDTGGYTVDVELLTGQVHCEESLPGESGLSEWPVDITPITFDGEGNWSGSGNLSTGGCVNLDFASDSAVACFPATQEEHFQGNHLFFALDEPMPPRSVLTISAVPDASVDVSLYGIQMGEDYYYVPPYIPSVLACEASNSTGDCNPGTTETIQFYNPDDVNEYNVLVGVAGNGETGTSGAFTVNATLVTATEHCIESLPGYPYMSWPSSVQVINQTQGTITGDLSEGSCVNLAWASDSATACFPATMDEYYQGNHVFYALERPLQPGTIATVTVTPSEAEDISVYGYLIGSTSFYVPPYVPGTVSCEYANGDGTARVITFNNPQTNSGDYNLFFGVAGTATDGTTGGYTVDVAIEN